MNASTTTHAISPTADLPPGFLIPSDLPVQTTAPLQKIHELLRGRYAWVIALGLLGALAGAVGSYKLLVPEYTSTGAILIKPSIRTILYPLEEHDAPRMFDEYVDAQLIVMSSPRVLDHAMATPEWKKLGRKLLPEVTEAFSNSLTIERGRRSHVIHLAFTDPDITAARTGVQAVIRSYEKIANETEDQNGARTQLTLERLKTKLNTELQDLKDRAYNIDPNYSPNALRRMWDFKLEEMKHIAESLQETQIMLVTAGAVNPEEDGGESETVSLSVHQIAVRDSLMRTHLAKKMGIESELAAKTSMLGSNHRNVKSLTGMLSDVNRIILDYKREYESNPVLANSFTRGGTRLLATASIPELRVRQKVLRELRDHTRDEMTVMSRSIRVLEGLEQRITQRDEQLSQVDQRMEEIRIEMNPTVSGRIEVISSGLTTPEPSNDGTRKQVAVAGFAVGGSLGVGIVMLISLLDRRIRNSDDVRNQASDVRMLGVLPGLPKDLTDPEHAAVAGYCVHYIRTLLQLGSSPDTKKVIAITSPASGTGKTSLTLALGLSFAASGSRTLLIDCDLGNGGLTSRLNAIIRRRIGQILQRQGLITAEQLTEALADSEKSGKRLGESLVARGVLQQSDLSAALETQEEAQIGLLDALDAEPFDTCVAETGTPSLCILPIGGARAHDMNRMSPSTVGHVIDEARKRFDTVLLDTGPIPGTIETSIVATEADEVVLVVARGGNRGHAEKAIRFLESIGATMAGLVFNRAAPRDVARSVTTAAALTQSPDDHPNVDVPGHGGSTPGSKRYDPITQSVVRSSNPTGDES